MPWTINFFSSHFLCPYMYNMNQWRDSVCCCLVAKSCPTLCDPMDCSPPGLSVHGIFQARILGWVVFSFSRGSSQPRDQNHIPWIGRWFLYLWVTRETLRMSSMSSSLELEVTGKTYKEKIRFIGMYTIVSRLFHLLVNTL